MKMFEIEQELLLIFAEIEDAEGEITPEMEERLNISEKDLIEKLDKYRVALSKFTSDSNGIKEELNRLRNYKSTIENRANKLKEVMTNAVMLFGNEGKTNKYVELPTSRISTRNNKSVNIFSDKVNNIIEEFKEFMAVEAEDGTENSIYDFINWYNYKNDNGITDDDCRNINLNFSFDISLEDALLNPNNIIKNAIESILPHRLLITDKLNKTEIKKNIDKEQDITIGCVDINQSLIIK